MQLEELEEQLEEENNFPQKDNWQEKKNAEVEEIETIVMDSNPDAYRIKCAEITENCIMNFSYVFAKLHEIFDEHCRGVEGAFRDL